VDGGPADVDPQLPHLALIVSGGHTDLVLVHDHGQYHVLGRTLDDAAGEALDKIAKFLGLGYPGGPVIQKLGSSGNPQRFPFALPRMKDASLDFSFSGLKTAALRWIEEAGLSARHPALADFLASFEAAVVRALLQKLDRGAEKVTPASLILCGGVARNRRLRAAFVELARARGYSAHLPSPDLCTDNAAMVGALAVEKLKSAKKPGLDLELDAYPRFTSAMA
jgi:N6-L-threonylcarbamoyladenine synthase